MSQQRSISGSDLDDAVTSDDILGKEVIDVDGRFIGIAEKVFIHPKTLDFVGISVDKGIIRKSLSIGKDYIEKIASKAVFLNISVSYEIKGLKVFDKDGKDLGRVKKVLLKGSENTIESILIAQGLGREISVSAKDIDRIGYNVILKTTKQEISEMQQKDKCARR